MGFIKELKKEHGQIVVLLDKIGSGKLKEDELALKMTQWEEILLQHVTKEESKIHPALAEAGEANKKLGKLIQRSSNEMADVTISVVLFFKKYSGQAIQGAKMKKKFAADFKNLRKALMERVEVEENLLFTEYEKLFPDNS